MIKSILLSIVSIFLSFFAAQSQDLIIKANKDTIQAKVIEFGIEEIRYKQFDFLDGPTFVILKNDVRQINYENGKIEILSDNQSTVPGAGTTNYFLKGQKDATFNYKGYKDAGTLTLLVSLLSPLLGLVPAITTSSTTPKEHKLNYPSETLMKNNEYRTSYTTRAKKIKQGKVWTNWGIAFGVNVILIILISSGDQ